MAVAEGKIQISATIPEDLFSVIALMADVNNRSFSYMIGELLQEAVTNRKNKN